MPPVGAVDAGKFEMPAVNMTLVARCKAYWLPATPDMTTVDTPLANFTVPVPDPKVLPPTTRVFVLPR